MDGWVESGHVHTELWYDVHTHMKTPPTSKPKPNKQITKQDPLLVAEEEGGLYQAERQLMVDMLEALVAKQGKGNKLRAKMLEGDWELVYTTRQLFRSSPFFQAVARAYNDPSKSELFFKLHELQTCSWGASQIGRVAQVSIRKIER